MNYIDPAMNYLSTKEIRQIIKEQLGYNTRQVSVKRGCSYSYVICTVRDPKVNLRKVNDLMKSLDTWSMDMVDYCTGQRVAMEIADSVKVVICADILEECVNFLENPTNTTIDGVSVTLVDELDPYYHGSQLFCVGDDHLHGIHTTEYITPENLGCEIKLNQ